MGGLRFTLWGLVQVAKLRTWRAKLSYLKAASTEPRIRFMDEDSSDEEDVGNSGKPDTLVHPLSENLPSSE